jgi:hypothetical protein
MVDGQREKESAVVDENRRRFTTGGSEGIRESAEANCGDHACWPAATGRHLVFHLWHVRPMLLAAVELDSG